MHYDACPTTPYCSTFYNSPAYAFRFSQFRCVPNRHLPLTAYHMHSTTRVTTNKPNISPNPRPTLTP
jgi:hypothetical protein